MLKEFVESIVGLAKKAEDPQLIDLPGNRLMLVTPHSVETLDKDRKTHKDALLSFTSFTDLCNDCDPTSLVIKVSDTRLTVVENRNYPHDSDTAYLSLCHTAAYADLLDWCKQPRGVRSAVQGMRSKLAGTFDLSYLSVFKRLDFSRKNDGTKSVTHTGESMGRSVEMAAQSGAGEIPDVMLFEVKLFTGLPIESYELRFACTVNPETETIALTPVGDCLEEAHHSTRVELVARLKTEFQDALVIESLD